MARPERFERPTLRFVVWGKPLKLLEFVTVGPSPSSAEPRFSSVLGSIMVTNGPASVPTWWTGTDPKPVSLTTSINDRAGQLFTELPQSPCGHRDRLHAGARHEVRERAMSQSAQ